MGEYEKMDDSDEFYEDAINFHSKHFTTLNDGKILVELGKDFCSTNWLEIDKFVKAIASADDSKINSIVSGTDDLSMSNDPIATRYHSVNLLHLSRDADRTYSPGIQLFYDVADDVLANNPATADEFRLLIKKIREKTQAQEFKKKVNRKKEKLKANEKATLSYLNSIFDHCSRLLILRIDLHLKMPNLSRMDQHSKIRECFTQFLNNRRNNKFFNHELGYIWKFEDGMTLGGHYHLIVILDGAHVQKDEFIASQIGEYWKKITSDEGTYFNSNSKKYLDDLATRGIGKGVGRIESHDTEKRAHLTRVVKYFFKMEQYVEVKLTRGARSFGKGEFKKPKAAGGRPRKKRE